MEARSEFRISLHGVRMPTRPSVWPARRIAAAAAAGIAGGVALLAPLVIYDWARSTHSALEALMAPTAWLFGLEYFHANGYAWGPILLGVVIVAAVCALAGMAFGAIADRVVGADTTMGVAALGVAWSVATFLTFWTMVLPIARDGAPFRATAAAAGVAPHWVWIVAFVALGVVTSFAYAIGRARDMRERRPV